MPQATTGQSPPGLHEVCVRVGVLYVITKFSRMDCLPNFVTHGAPLRALRARELRYYIHSETFIILSAFLFEIFQKC